LSALSHHVTSLHLDLRLYLQTPVTCDTLRPLRGLPRLTPLQLTLSNNNDVERFMQGMLSDNTAAALRAVLPTQLRSFGVLLGAIHPRLRKQTAALASSFWAALDDMRQLTELRIEQHSEHMHVRQELTQLHCLRKLTLGPAGWRGEHVDSLKQLSQLRELTFHDQFPDRIRLTGQRQPLLLAAPSMSGTAVAAPSRSPLLNAIPFKTAVSLCFVAPSSLCLP
jgi:hypothetical protein